MERKRSYRSNSRDRSSSRGRRRRNSRESRDKQAHALGRYEGGGDDTVQDKKMYHRDNAQDDNHSGRRSSYRVHEDFVNKSNGNNKDNKDNGSRAVKEHDKTRSYDKESIRNKIK